MKTVRWFYCLKEYYYLNEHLSAATPFASKNELWHLLFKIPYMQRLKGFHSTQIFNLNFQTIHFGHIFAHHIWYKNTPNVLLSFVEFIQALL